MPTAVIYARFSCSKQREASIEDQLRECRAWCELRGYEVVGEYCDYAVSGRTDARPEFQRMISNAGESDIVLVYMMDRFSRDIYDAPIYKKQLRDHGVKVVSATESLPDCPESILLESMYEAMAAMESAKNSMRTKRGMEGKALKGLYTGDRVFGYKEDKETGKYAIDESDAAIVREVFDRRVKGEAYNAIARDLARRGVKTYTGKPCSPTMVQHMIRNPRYKGLYKWADVEIDGGMPVIVDSEVWEMAQKVRKSKRREREVWDEYVLSGKSVCGCGRNLVGVSGRSSSGKKYSYYRCGGRCGAAPTSKGWLEDSVSEALRALVSDRDKALEIGRVVEAYNAESDGQAEIDRARRIIAESEKALRNIQSALEAGIYTDATKDRIAELKADKRRAEQRLEQLSVELPTADDIADFLQFASTLDDKALMDALVWQVIVTDDDVTVLLNYDMNGEPASLTFEKASMWSEDANKTIRTPSSKDVRTRSIWLTTHGFIRTCVIGGRIAVIIERAA